MKDGVDNFYSFDFFLKVTQNGCSEKYIFMKFS
jgi:hypothetical protein